LSQFSLQRPRLQFAKRFEIIDEGWAVTGAGYFDRKVLVKFRNGQVREIQLWHPSVLRAKEESGHRLYVESSKLPVDHPRQAEIAAENEADLRSRVGICRPRMEGIARERRQSRKHPVECLLGHNAPLHADFDGIFACPGLAIV
jgi:hypothetical protein